MIRLLLVQSVRMLADLMISVLQEQTDMEVVDCVYTKKEALTWLRRYHCDVILIDSHLPDDAYCLLHEVIALQTGSKVLITGLLESEATILRCLEEGAAGYVLEGESLNEFVNKIRAVQRDEFILSPTISNALIMRIAELKRTATELNGFKASDLNPSIELTAREREVLKLIEQGFTNFEIAKLLMIELGTVKNHVHNIFGKLGVGSRQYAALYARQMQVDEALKTTVDR